jgi:hypothetical protein
MKSNFEKVKDINDIDNIKNKMLDEVPDEYIQAASDDKTQTRKKSEQLIKEKEDDYQIQKKEIQNELQNVNIELRNQIKILELKNQSLTQEVEKLKNKKKKSCFERTYTLCSHAISIMTISYYLISILNYFEKQYKIYIRTLKH